MDFLNKAYAQLLDLFRSMTPGARLTSGLLLAVLLASFGYLIQGRSSGPDEYLMGGRSFPQEQIPNMLGAFAQKGLKGAHADGLQIRIPAGQEMKFLGALMENNAMPQDYGDIMEAALQGNSLLGETREKFQERVKNALEEKCRRLLRASSFVADALPHWDVGTKPGMLREKVFSASVSVTPKGHQEFSAQQVQSIRQGVACFVAGMKPENVTVTNTATGRTYNADDSGMASAFNDAYAERKKQYEEETRANILRALPMIPGLSVSTFVTLDPRSSHREHAVKYDPKPVVVQSTDKNFSKLQEGTSTQGRPGFTANTPQSLQPATSKGNRQEEEKGETVTINAVPGSTQDTEFAGLTPKKVTAVIGVPMSYFEQIWRIAHPADPASKEPAKPATPAELEQLRQAECDKVRGIVANLLPDAEAVTDKKELVKVEAFQDLPTAEIPATPMSEQAMSWLGESWRTLGMLLLVLVSLVMLRSMIRAAPIASDAPMMPVAARSNKEPEAAPQLSAAAEAARRLQRFQTGTSLKDELIVLVNEDPDAAANILRTWIGHPG